MGPQRNQEVFNMRILTIAAAALFIAGAAFAQDTSGASKSHMGNPKDAPTSQGGQTSTTGASKTHAGNPSDMPAKTGTQQPALNDKGQLPAGKAKDK
jgi:hypothetical protein